MNEYKHGMTIVEFNSKKKRLKYRLKKNKKLNKFNLYLDPSKVKGQIHINRRTLCMNLNSGI